MGDSTLKKDLDLELGTASTNVTDPSHGDLEEDRHQIADDNGRQTERHLVPHEDLKSPIDESDFGDFHEDDSDFGEFETAQKEESAVVCDRLQRPMRPLSKATKSSADNDSFKSQGKLLEDYSPSTRKPISRLSLKRTSSLNHPYGLEEKVEIAFLETKDSVVTSEVAKYFQTQCERFCQETWKDLSLREVFLNAIGRLGVTVRMEESDVVLTTETQQGIDTVQTPFELGEDTKDLDSSYLGTLPGSSFIASDANSASLAEVLGEPIPDLSFVLCAGLWSGE